MCFKRQILGIFLKQVKQPPALSHVLLLGSAKVLLGSRRSFHMTQLCPLKLIILLLSKNSTALIKQINLRLFNNLAESLGKCVMCSKRLKTSSCLKKKALSVLIFVHPLKWTLQSASVYQRVPHSGVRKTLFSYLVSYCILFCRLLLSVSILALLYKKQWVK